MRIGQENRGIDIEEQSEMMNFTYFTVSLKSGHTHTALKLQLPTTAVTAS